MNADATRVPVRRADYRPSDWLVDRIELRFALDLQHTRVAARLGFRRRPGVLGTPPLHLDGDAASLRRVALDGRALAVEVPGAEAEVVGSAPESSVLCVLLPGQLCLEGLPDSGVLEFETLLHPAANTALEGLYASAGMLLTQCEAEGFRRITFMLDRPDILAVYTVELLADAARFPVLLSNGNLLEQQRLPDGRQRALWHDPHPKPSYLFAIVAGDLACRSAPYTTAEGRQVELRLYAEAALLPRLEFALAALVKAMRFDEQRFGRSYDLNLYQIVATLDFNMGAMENKGLNIFNAKNLLGDPQTATDLDFAHIEAVVAHEYFHNWTGNRITCRDWFELSLKEGLTVYREQEFTAHAFNAAVKRIEDVRQLQAVQYAEDASPLAHAVRPDSYLEINNFYTATVYEKGAELVRMLHTWIGSEAFRRGMDLYFARHDGQAATIEDFLRCHADAAGMDLDGFLRWYAQAGTPLLRVQTRHDAARAEFTLELAQSTPATPGQPHKLPVPIPLRLALLDEQGRPLPLRRRGDPASAACSEYVLRMEAERETHVFEQVPAPRARSLLRGLSAPVRLSLDQDDAELAFLLAHDDDAVVRADAAQRLHRGALLAALDAAALDQDRNLAPAPLLVEALTALLQRPLADPALLAQALLLPSSAELADHLLAYDPLRTVQLRTRMQAALAAALAPALWHCLALLPRPETYAFEPGQVGRRLLRNRVLDLLANLGPTAASTGHGTGSSVPASLPAATGELQRLLHDEYAAADNLTDREAALRRLLHADHPGADTALAAFEQRYAADPLVLDKWFAVQAGVPQRDQLARVQALLAHPAFSPDNPNKLRALLGSFARECTAGFHRADGAGYRLIASQVARLDRSNPQTGSRLAQLFARHRNLLPPYRDQLRAALEALRPGLQSPDLREVVEKVLA